MYKVKMQEMAREVRFLQWKQIEESTEALLRSRVSVLVRFWYYQRLLGEASDPEASRETLTIHRPSLTGGNLPGGR